MKYSIASLGQLYSVIKLIEIYDNNGVHSTQWDFDNPLIIVNTREDAECFIQELLREEQNH